VAQVLTQQADLTDELLAVFTVDSKTLVQVLLADDSLVIVEVDELGDDRCAVLGVSLGLRRYLLVLFLLTLDIAQNCKVRRNLRKVFIRVLTLIKWTSE